VIVALVLYCWARGVRSARRIERACVEDVACRVIVAQQRPDHATIARFIVRHERALQGLFGEVLALCAEAGLASVGVIAIDGTKIAANANRDRTVDYEQIAREIVEEAIATDNAENEQFGERRGDELGPDVPVGEGRRDWLRRRRRSSSASAHSEQHRSRARARSAWLTRSSVLRRSSRWSAPRTRNTRLSARAGSTRPVGGCITPTASPIRRRRARPAR